jgi:hypothetical protein
MKVLAILGGLSILFTLRGIGANDNDHPLFNDPDEQYRFEEKMGIPHRRGAYEQWREFEFYDEAAVKSRFPELTHYTLAFMKSLASSSSPGKCTRWIWTLHSKR